MGGHSRRGFLARTLGGAWVGASLIEQAVMRAAQARAQAQRAPQPVLFDIEKIADGVYGAVARRQPQVNCNAVIFENAADVLIVDAHSKPSAVVALTAQVRSQITAKPIRYIVNTHFHWDHTQGNPTYRKLAPHADILASTETRRLLAELGAARLKQSVQEASRSLERYRQQLASAKTAEEKDYWQQMVSGTTGYIAEMKDYAPELPNITFDRTLVLHDKAHELHLSFRGRGHTSGDAVVFCPQKKVVATGDLMHGWLPYIDDGYPRDWPKTLAAIAELPFEHALGGHGEVQHGKERLQQMAAYITELAETVDAAKRQGRSLEEVQRSLTPAKMKSMAGSYRQFVAGQLGKYDMHAGLTSPEEYLTRGVRTNVEEVFHRL